MRRNESQTWLYWLIYVGDLNQACLSLVQSQITFKYTRHEPYNSWTWSLDNVKSIFHILPQCHSHSQSHSHCHSHSLWCHCAKVRICRYMLRHRGSVAWKWVRLATLTNNPKSSKFDTIYLVINIISFNENTFLIKIFFQSSMMNVDHLLGIDVDLGTMSQQKFNDRLVRVRFGVVKSSVAISVFPVGYQIDFRVNVFSILKH